MDHQNIESVSLWLERFKDGDTAAVQPLWNAYFTKMVTLARVKLGTTPRGVRDEDDVANSAFFSFCEGVKAGRFPRLDSRDDLWAILFTIVVSKAAQYTRSEMRQKRGGGKIIQASGDAGDGTRCDLLANLQSAEPTAADAAMMVEDLRKLLQELGDGNLQQIAIWKMEGYTNREIANMIGKSEPTVERKLKIIRETWLRKEPKSL
jgi:DNA-directed RNA polymerase specialized sigma24 family protein